MASELDKALEANMPETAKGQAEIIQITPSPTPDMISGDMEDDYKFARGQIKKMIQHSNDAIEQIGMVAGDSEHPRAFEVMGTMIKQNADMTSQMLDLLKTRQEINKKEGKNDTPGGTTNNTVFLGTTTELMNMLNDKSNVVDV